VLVLGLVLVLMDCTKLPALSTSAAMIQPSADGTSVWRRKVEEVKLVRQRIDSSSRVACLSHSPATG